MSNLSKGVYVIELKLEGEEYGGNLLVERTPQEVVKIKKSLTGKYLKESCKVIFRLLNQ